MIETKVIVPHLKKSLFASFVKPFAPSSSRYTKSGEESTVLPVEKKMTKLVTITAIAASLLFLSAQAYSEQANAFTEEMVEVTDPSCQQVTCGDSRCRVCATPGHRHGVGVHHGVGIHHGIGLPIIGLPCPEFLHGQLLQGQMFQGWTQQERGDSADSDSAYVQRLGGTEPIRQCPIQRAMVPMPIGPPPSNFVGGVLQPQRYQQAPLVGYGGAGYGAQGQGYAPGYYAPVPEQRIVYVPYASPPPIHVAQRGMMPRPPFMRRILGDANMYEYPEMPLQLYTTRGPRDFFAPNPPSIGE